MHITIYAYITLLFLQSIILAFELPICMRGRFYNGYCVEKESYELFCPKNTKNTFGGCLFELKEAPIKRCNLQASDIGGKCIYKTLAGIFVWCNNGFEENSECVEYVNAMELSRCSIGYEESQNNTCIKTVELFCNQKYYEPILLQRNDVFEAIMSGKKCYLTFKKKKIVDRICPADSYMTDNFLCKFNKKTSMNVKCLFKDSKKCIMEYESKYENYCRSGYIQKPNYCVKQYILPRLKRCLNGAILFDGKNCYKILELPKTKI